MGDGRKQFIPRINPRLPRRSLDCQLFAGEKTERPTPRRRREARQKGQVYKSQEISSALLLLATFAIIYISLPHMKEEFVKLFTFVLSLNPGVLSTPAGLIGFYPLIILSFGKLLFPLLATVLVTGLMSNILQTGFILSGEPLHLKPERLNPIEGFKRIFSRRALIQLLKSLAKLMVVLIITRLLVKKFLNRITLLSLMEMEEGIGVIGYLAMRLGLGCGAALLIVGLMDILYQRWEHERSLMMSKEEIKEEMKRMEGDPQLRARIRERQRQMAARRMMEDVPKADLVVTNPSQYAVALKYDAPTMSAPVVLAKGKGYMAQRIKDLAQSHEIALVENRPLAQGLYWGAEIGEEIPAEFYQAVAEVLAFVYQLQNRY
ncbi:MAG: flagellar biosynthesis protein FlhB [Firmicutes bacterium]|nr:flagellar biosynthesis protein FlhB [Bacillota bacterium]